MVIQSKAILLSELCWHVQSPGLGVQPKCLPPLLLQLHCMFPNVPRRYGSNALGSFHASVRKKFFRRSGKSVYVDILIILRNRRVCPSRSLAQPVRKVDRFERQSEAGRRPRPYKPTSLPSFSILTGPFLLGQLPTAPSGKSLPTTATSLWA